MLSVGSSSAKSMSSAFLQEIFGNCGEFLPHQHPLAGP